MLISVSLILKHGLIDSSQLIILSIMYISSSNKKEVYFSSPPAVRSCDYRLVILIQKVSVCVQSWSVGWHSVIVRSTFFLCSPLLDFFSLIWELILWILMKLLCWGINLVLHIKFEYLFVISLRWGTNSAHPRLFGLLLVEEMKECLSLVSPLSFKAGNFAK